jgi:hypothetical protein
LFDGQIAVNDFAFRLFENLRVNASSPPSTKTLFSLLPFYRTAAAAAA